MKIILRRCIAITTRPHRIGWQNNEKTKLTIEPGPETKDLQNIGVQGNFMLNNQCEADG